MKAVEALADSWASIDGKLDQFRDCKASPMLEEDLGSYEGYMAEAQEMIKRIEVRGFKLVPLEVSDEKWRSDGYEQ